MFEVRVSFTLDDDFALNDNWLRSIVGPSNSSGAGLGVREHCFERFDFNEALKIKETIKESCPLWNVTMREK